MTLRVFRKLAKKIWTIFSRLLPKLTSELLSQINQNSTGNQNQNTGNVSDNSIVIRNVGGDLYYGAYKRPATDAQSYEQQGRLVGEKIFEDDKYGGRLVTILLEIYEKVPSEKICPTLSITFGNTEVKIPDLKEVGKNTDIKFGMTAGELCFSLINGAIPLNQRELVVSQDNNWRGESRGIPAEPFWAFGFHNNLIDENQLKVLSGGVRNKKLGIIELSRANTYCEIKATFKVNINRINIVIINLDDGTTTDIKKLKETKIGLLLKYLKTELELDDYVYKVVIKYDPVTIS